MISYPYPVMSSLTDCYIRNTVNWAEPEKRIDGPNIVVTAEFSIEDDKITYLLDSGRVKAYAMVYCPRTDYRELFDLSDGRIEIPSGDVADTVNIEESLIALEDIDCSEIGDLSEDFCGLSVTVPKNGYVAKNDFTFHVDRELEPDSDSICKFMKDNIDHVEYDRLTDYIIIKLPEETYYRYMSLDSELKKTYTAMYFSPILVELISDYWKDQDVPGSDTMWYRVIDKVISEKYPKGIEDLSAFDVMESILGPLLDNASRIVKDRCNGGE